MVSDRNWLDSGRIDVNDNVRHLCAMPTGIHSSLRLRLWAFKVNATSISQARSSGQAAFLEVALDQLLRNTPESFGHGVIARLGGRSLAVAVREVGPAYLCESR